MRQWDDDTASHYTRTGDPAHATRVSLVNSMVLLSRYATTRYTRLQCLV